MRLLLVEDDESLRLLTARVLEANGYAGQTGCAESVAKIIAEEGLAPPKLPDPVNLFMHVDLQQDGSILPRANATRAGDFVACRVTADMTVIVSACCTGIEGNDKPGMLELATAEELIEL